MACMYTIRRKAMEIVDVLRRTKVDLACVQVVKSKGFNARNICHDYTRFYPVEQLREMELDYTCLSMERRTCWRSVGELQDTGTDTVMPVYTFVATIIKLSDCVPLQGTPLLKTRPIFSNCRKSHNKLRQ